MKNPSNNLHFKEKIKDIFSKQNSDNLIQKIKNKFILHPSQFQVTVYFLIATGVLCYIISWLKNRFTVPLGGDYYMQEMNFIYNFYDDYYHYFKTGEFIFFDTSTIMGIDNIAGNSFYGLFNPFNLILLIFPRNIIMYVQGIMLPIKMIIGGLLFHKYLGAFDFSMKSKRIGAIAYAFCGYSFGYLWFHFIDSVAFLPLILLGVEKIIQKLDMRTLILGFFLTAMVNYFFFVVFMIGAFLYAIFRLLQTVKSRNRTENYAVLGMGIFGFVVSILISSFTLFPALFLIRSVPRVANKDPYIQGIQDASGLKELIEAIFTFPYSHQHNAVTPLLNFLFIPIGCYYSNLLNVNWYDNFQNSLYATTPLMLLFFVSIINSIKEKKISHLIAVAFNALLVLTPIGYYLFSVFTVGYARFFILQISFMIVYDLKALEKRREIPRYYLDISFVIVVILEAISAYLIIFQVDKNPNYFKGTGWDERMILILFSMIYLVVVYLILRVFFHKKKLNCILPVLVSLDCIVMGNATIIGHGTVSLDNIAGGLDNVNTETKIVELLKKVQDENQYYRIYNTTADRNNNNISMKEGYNGVGTFHSVYPYQSQDFLDRSRIPYTYKNWSMGIHNHRMNLETFLGVKYYLVNKVYPSDRSNVVFSDSYNIPYGYEDITNMSDETLKMNGISNAAELKDYLNSLEKNKKQLYVNTNYIDTFFVYDQILPTSFLNDGYYEDLNEYSLLRACVLEDEDFVKFAKNNKYNSSSITFNGKKTEFDFKTIDPIKNNVSTYRNALTTRDYQKGNSAPIQVFNALNSKITVYKTNWPATENNPDGKYARCSIDDPYDDSCVSKWREENPFMVANEIYPADIKFDYDSRKDDQGNMQDNTVLYNSKLIIERDDGSNFCEDIVKEDKTTHCYISIKSSDDIQWRFFDEENKLICSDRPSFSDYKLAHGFYVDRPVKKIVGIYKQGTKSKPNILSYYKRPELYIQRAYDYQQAIDKLKKNKVEIVSRNNSKVVIKTDYQTSKMISTNYPYSASFKVYKKIKEEDKETLKEVDVYKTQGGFVGFEAEAGESEYLINYVTQGYNVGAMFTIVGLVSTFAVYMFYSLRKDYYDSDKYLLSYNLEKRIKEKEYKKRHFEDEINY